MSQKGTILMVEDQKGFRRIYVDVLTHAGYEVLTAEDGEIGWQLVREKKPGLVLLDLGLPKLNGFEVLQKMKADIETRDIPVIIFSVVGEQKDIDKALAMGANDYTIKGFSENAQILGKIAQYLSQREPLKNDAPSRPLPIPLRPSVT